MDAPNPSSWEQWVLLRSDVHLDNRHCDRKMARKHLEAARDRDAIIMDAGDLACVMQGKYDPRKGPAIDVLEEYRNTSKPYLDAVVDDIIDFHKPYAHNFATMSPGNHESSIMKRAESDINTRVVDGLNLATGSSILRRQYQHWAIFRVRVGTGSRKTATLKMFTHHGHGGGGIVTKGVIGSNRRSDMLDGVRVVHTGHVHESWALERPKAVLTDSGSPGIVEAWHVCTPGYKEEFLDSSGYHVEGGRPPKPLGAWWMRLWLDGTTLMTDFVKAR